MLEMTKEASKDIKRSRLSTKERKAQLLRLGVDLFTETPYENISIDDIAKAAGISKGLLYHYFPNKRSFYVASIELALQALVSTTIPEQKTDAPAHELLRCGLQRYLDFVDENASSYTFLMRAGLGIDPRVIQMVRDTRRKHLESMMDDAGVSMDNALVRNALAGYLGCVEASCIDWLDHRDLDKEQLLAQLMQQFMHIAQGPLAHIYMK